MKTCPLCDKSWPSHHTSCPTDGATLIDSRELDPGTIIRGKYRIQRLLGRGGMGAVYLAEHILLARPRALKFISGDLTQDPAFLRRFRREALAAIELRHPNVVEVVDLDQAEDGSPYIAMEFVDGPDLRHALNSSLNCHPERSAAESKDLRLPFGAFPVERALHIARGIAQGLAAAHAKGIIHRDVKPENILLANPNTSAETPKLLDFGIAAVHETVTAVSRTRGLMLTPPYASPEQWRGLPADQLDGRADLYALGGVLYEMLTGQTPFHAHNSEGWMYQHLNEQPQPPSHLRPELANWQGLDALVLSLLAKDRDQRPRDAAEFTAQLDAVYFDPPRPRPQTVVYVSGRVPTQAQADPEVVTLSYAKQKRPRRFPRWRWTASVALLLVVGFALWRIRGPEPLKPPLGTPAQTVTQGSDAQRPFAPKSTNNFDTSGLVLDSQPLKPPSPTLLISCDLSCDWTLDGKPQGRIADGKSAEVSIALGRHFVIADSTDEVAPAHCEKTIEVRSNAQTTLSIALAPIRSAQLSRYYSVYTKPDVIYLRTVFNEYLSGRNEQESVKASEFELLSRWDRSYYRSKFIVLSIENAQMGGVWVTIIFQDHPDRVFRALVINSWALAAFDSPDRTEENMEKIRTAFRQFLEDREHAL